MRMTLSLVLCLIVIGVGQGCKKVFNQTPSRLDRLAVARNQLENMIESSSRKDRPYSRYLVARARHGMGLLEASAATGDPALISVGIRLASTRNAIGLWFADPDFRVIGLVVESDTGWKQTFSCIRWTENDRKWFSVTILRDIGVQLELIDGNDPAGHVSTEPATLVVMPRAALNGRVRVGLLEENGAVTEMVEACIWKMEPE